MSSDLDPNDREREFRRALVATVDLSPYVRRRPTPRLVVALVTAFVLAGALTGGAVATVTKPDAQLAQAQAQAQAASGAKAWVRSIDGHLIGHPFIRSASGSQSISVGPKPTSANALIEGFGCLDAGHIVGYLDSKKFDSFEDCSQGGSGATRLVVTGAGEHVVTFHAGSGVRYAVWLSWAQLPRFTESAAQKRELADGVVTRDEEVAAFDRYAGCMDALGHPVGDQATSIIPGSTVSNSSVADGSVTRCRESEFNGVDIKWRRELSSSAVGTASIAACAAKDKTSNDGSAGVVVTPGPDVLDLGSCPWIG